jgi:hypothetical protein
MLSHHRVGRRPREIPSVCNSIQIQISSAVGSVTTLYPDYILDRQIVDLPGTLGDKITTRKDDVPISALTII